MISKRLLFFALLIVLQAQCKRPSQEDFCPNSCTSSENGRCSTRFKQCLCNRGFFDFDCGKQVPSLSDGALQILSVSPSSWEYFYMDLDYTMEDLTFEFEASNTTVDYYFLLQDPEESVLPENTDFRTLKVSSSGEHPQIVSIGSPKLEEFEGGLLLVGIQNTDSQQTVTVKVKNNWGEGETSSFFSKSTELLSWGLIIGVFVVICIAILRILGWEFVEDEDGMIIFIRNPQDKKIKKSLSKEDLDAYFPIKKFDEIDVSFDQTSCSVCLVDYNAKDSCRRLDCEHIFHHNCIEDWLAKNNSCPNCKVQISPKAS